MAPDDRWPHDPAAVLPATCGAARPMQAGVDPCPGLPEC
jgi:hypothetical protein